MTGETPSDDFPVTVGAFDTTHNGNYDAFLIELNPIGSDLKYSTFLGGGGNDKGEDLAVDGSGNVYVTGKTPSSDFPTTPEAFDITLNGSNDVFVTKINPSGSALVFSTFLGGSEADEGFSIALHSNGNAYVAGITWSANFPTTVGAFDTTDNGNYDVFITRLSQTGSVLDYSTFLGGSEDDYNWGIALDGSGNTYVVGYTTSANFPTTAGAFDTSYNGGGHWGDVFVSKLIIDLIPPEAIGDLTATLDGGSKSYGGNIYLSWSEPYDDFGISHYVVYRSTEPTLLGDSLALATDTFYLDMNVYAIGHPYLHYFYNIKAVDWGENKSPASNQVGEFDKVLRW